MIKIYFYNYFFNFYKKISKSVFFILKSCFNKNNSTSFNVEILSNYISSIFLSNNV